MADKPTDAIQAWFWNLVTQMILSPLTAPAAVFSTGTYMYPFRYFVTHPVLWTHLGGIVIPEMLLSLVVFPAFYLFAYPVQAVAAFFFNGPSGIFTAWVATMHQAAVATQILSHWLILPQPLTSIFDTTISLEGYDDLIVLAKTRRLPAALSPMSRVWHMANRIPGSVLSPVRVAKALFRLSMRFVPVIGPVALVVSDGPRYSRALHARYFDLRALDDSQKRQFVRERRGQYMGFGIVATGLESIPLMGIFFSFTNTVGAALWAVALEKERRENEAAAEFTTGPASRKSRRIGAFSIRSRKH